MHAGLQKTEAREHHAEIAIVGAGAIGLCCAVELARAGRSVVVVDRGEAGRGASWGNAGWLTPSRAAPLAQPGHAKKGLNWMLDPESPFYIKPSLSPALALWLLRFVRAGSQKRYLRAMPPIVELCDWSTDAWERFASEAPADFGFQRRGLLMLCESTHELDAALRTAELTKPMGVPYERWDDARIREAEPCVIGRSAGGIYFPKDAHCEPDLLMLALAAHARSLGVTILEQTEVTGARVEGGAVRALQTAKGEIGADSFVLAAGAWSGAVGKAFGLRIPMRAAKGYSLKFPRAGHHPERSIYLSDRKVAVNPHRETLRIAGTLELVGDDLSVNQRRVNAIIKGARAMLRFAEPQSPPEPWAGLRPCLPDGMPAIGRSPKLDNLWLAIGHQMTGVKSAPATGRLLADLMQSRTPSFDPAPFDPKGRC